MHGVPSTTLSHTFAKIDQTNNYYSNNYTSHTNTNENNINNVSDKETAALTELWQLLGLHHTTVEHMEAVLQARKNAEQAARNA